MKIACNGIICNEKEAVVSAYDHGFVYGIGLFETFRTYGGRPFLLEQHLVRLQQGCSELGIAYHCKLDYIEDIVGKLLEVNGLEDAYFRLSISAGVEMLGLPDGAYNHPSEIIYIKELPPRQECVYEFGKSLQKLRLRRNTPEGGIRLKSFHYMNNILAKRELQQYPWAEGAEGVFMDGGGYLAEGIVSNLFFVQAGVCYTPDLSTGILPGVTRAYVIELAKQAGLRVVEGKYTWGQLTSADEVFVTNSIQEIVPIRQLFDENGKSFVVASGSVGVYTKRLMEAYQAAIESVSALERK